MTTTPNPRGLPLPRADVLALMAGRTVRCRVPFKVQPPAWARQVLAFASGQAAYNPIHAPREARPKRKFFGGAPAGNPGDDGGWHGIGRCPFGPIGRRMYVKERWDYADGSTLTRPVAAYEVGGGPTVTDPYWRPARTMPAWAARLWAETADVKAERDDAVWWWAADLRPAEAPAPRRPAAGRTT